MIKHNEPTLGNREAKIAFDVITSQLVAQGRYVNEFEESFCQFLGLPLGHAAAVSSGSSALYLALLAVNVSRKHLVLPVLTCSAVKQAATLAGCSTECVDVSQNTPNMDVNYINNYEADAVVAAHMYGFPMDVRKITNKIIIEDCAQALGAKVDDHFVGTLGNVGVYSFYATKLITTGGEGGMVVSRDKNLIDYIKDYRDFDHKQNDKARFNFKMTDIQAAIGTIQLKRLPFFIKKRALLFDIYKQYGLNMLDACETTSHTPVRFRAILQSDQSDRVISILKKRGIEAAKLMTQDRLLASSERYLNATIFCKTNVSLPLYPNLRAFQVEHIANEVSKI